MNLLELNSFDKYLVTFSAGKDSIASFLWLLENGVDKSKIELWHHLVDGEGKILFDWECTEDYCRKFAEAFGVPIYFSWKVGGFEREMLRENSLTAPTVFETPEGRMQIGGTRGKLSTRRKFPQISPDLKTRYCSPYLKIDPCAAAIVNQERFKGIRTLVLSGERGEESPARAKYKTFEPDRTFGKNREVYRCRPVRDWLEGEVWAIIERWKILVHPCYYLGFSRCSCKFCIFGNKDQFATAAAISPSKAEILINYEKGFGVTMKRTESLSELISKGVPYQFLTPELIAAATSTIYYLPIFTDVWQLPPGAFGEGCGAI